jgi:hypothetical protein
MFCLLALVSACSPDGEGLSLVELGVFAAKDGHAESEVACEALPVLQGSHRYTELRIDSAFTITVFSSPIEAQVLLVENGRLLEERVIDRGTLEGEYLESWTITLQTGASYVVRLASECSP